MGIAAPAILSFLIIADAYPVKKQQYFMALLNGIMNTAIGFAPVVGSYITLYFHWQGNFLTLLSLGLITLLITIIFVPRHRAQVKTASLRLRYSYFALFKSKPLLLLMTHIICMFIPYWIFVGMSPLLYMKNLGVSLSYFGFYQGSLALVFGLGSIIFGFILHRYQHRNMLYLSWSIYIISFTSVAYTTFIESSKPLLITLAFIPFIIGQIPSNLLGPLCLNFIPQAKGKISAVLQGSRLIFSALALQLAGYFYQGTFHNIGIIIMFFILMGIITMGYLLKNQQIMVVLEQ